MFLEGMSKEDCKILDILWSINTVEELNAYLKGLSGDRLIRTLTLMEMMTLASIDDAVNAMTEFPEVKRMIMNAKGKGK